MKILYIAFAGTDQLGVHRKLAEQVLAMRGCGHDVECLVFADLRAGPAPADMPYTFIDLAGGGFGPVSRPKAFEHCRKVTARFRPDIVYMRYPIYDSHVLAYVKHAPPVVFELQTIFEHEAPPAAAEFEARWAAEVLPVSAGIVAMTSQILRHETARAGWMIPGHVMPNGADPEQTPFVVPSLSTQRVDLLCVAYFNPWHGIDRVIVGMAVEPDVPHVQLHLVGDGAALPSLRALVREARLEERVHFHGVVAGNELAPFYAASHVAIGCLAGHRKGLLEVAALKHREYALSGLPMVMAGEDADFTEPVPWLRKVPLDDSPISPRTFRSLALGWTAEARRRQIRTWGETHLSWAAKVPALVSFFQECIERRDGSGSLASACPSPRSATS